MPTPPRRATRRYERSGPPRPRQPDLQSPDPQSHSGRVAPPIPRPQRCLSVGFRPRRARGIRFGVARAPANPRNRIFIPRASAPSPRGRKPPSRTGKPLCINRRGGVLMVGGGVCRDVARHGSIPPRRVPKSPRAAFDGWAGESSRGTAKTPPLREARPPIIPKKWGFPAIFPFDSPPKWGLSPISSPESSRASPPIRPPSPLPSPYHGRCIFGFQPKTRGCSDAGTAHVRPRYGLGAFVAAWRAASRWCAGAFVATRRVSESPRSPLL